MSQRDACIYMLGVFDNPGGSRMKKTDAFIDVSQFPQQQLDLHNNPITCPRERRAYVGQWKLCVVIRVPAARRLDVTALKMFWRRRSRTLEKRIVFGVQLARALKLVCFADLTHLCIAPLKQIVDENTLTGPPLCRVGETICFTTGSASANELARGAEQRVVGETVEFGDSTTPDWERLAHLVMTDPSAPLDTTSQTIQANSLELMLHSTNSAQRAAATTTLARVSKLASGPVTRANVGYAPFEQLRESVVATCSTDGKLDDALLFAHGDECYGDISEYWSRPMQRLRLHRVQRCVCGSHGTVTRRVRVRAPDGTSRFALICTVCQRSSVASVFMVPSIDALCTRVGAPNSKTSVLRLFDASCDVGQVTLDAPTRDESLPLASDSALTTALRKRKREM